MCNCIKCLEEESSNTKSEDILKCYWCDFDIKTCPYILGSRMFCSVGCANSFAD